MAPRFIAAAPLGWWWGTRWLIPCPVGGGGLAVSFRGRCLPELCFGFSMCWSPHHAHCHDNRNARARARALGNCIIECIYVHFLLLPLPYLHTAELQAYGAAPTNRLKAVQMILRRVTKTTAIDRVIAVTAHYIQTELHVCEGVSVG